MNPQEHIVYVVELEIYYNRLTPKEVQDQITPIIKRGEII